MPAPVKPCVGTFSEETLKQLVKNNDHAQWLSHPCDLCGQKIGARLQAGKWVPDPHWPSVRYTPRPKRAEKPALASR